MSDFSRTPPSDLEAEAAVIGCALLDPDCLGDVAEVVEPGDFYDKRKGEIFSVLLDMDRDSEPLDLGLLKARLRDNQRLERVGGRSHLAEIADSVPSASNAVFYARVVAELAVRRAVMAAASEISQRAQQHVDNVDAFVDWCEGRLFSARRRGAVRPYVGLDVVVGEVLDRIEAIRNGDVPLGLSSGLTSLDGVTGGFKAGELVILAARPGMGKSSLALSLAREMAMTGTRVGFFSLEVGRDDVGVNLLSQLSRINSRSLRKAEVGDEERFIDAAEALVGASGGVSVDDNGYQTLWTLRSRARRLVSREGCMAIFVDYLQLITPSNRRASRVEQVSEISRSLKLLAKELAVPVIALAQLSRKVEERPDKKPRMADLRESGSIEQDADVVLLLHRPAYYKPDDPEIAEDAHLCVAKNRNGPTGDVLLRFEPEFVRFSNATPAQIARQTKRGRR